MVLTGAVTPYPAQISQGEKQLVVFEGSHLVTAAYQVGNYFNNNYRVTNYRSINNLLSPVLESDMQTAPACRSLGACRI